LSSKEQVNYTKVMGGHQLFLSLGGNLGNKSKIFPETQDLIREQIGEILKISSPYESKAWGFQSRHLFLNQVIKVETCLSPFEVLINIRFIENHFGRTRKQGKYLSRKMDIDLLFYDNVIIRTEELTIPHPLLAERKFVLIPFMEIEPDFFHPLLKKNIRDICRDCQDCSIIAKKSPVN